MLIGACQFELFLPESHSLKSKRMIVQSLKTRIRNKFNVSVAEVGHEDKWQRACVGVALVANEHKVIDKTMSQLLRLIEVDGRAEILEHLVEVY